MKSPFLERRGFTLFELVLVLLLISLAAALVAPRAVSLSERRMEASARDMHAMARRARSVAVTRGITARMNFDAEAGSFWLEIEEDPFEAPGVFERAWGAWGEGMRLGEGVSFAEPPPESVLFKPDGSAQDSLVVITDGEGGRIGLEIRGATGLSRVVEGEELEFLGSLSLAGR